MPDAPVTAHDLVKAVMARHALPEWFTSPEITLDGRRLDLVAFNLWAAREYRVVGFEVKVSRGDWLRELGDYRKSERWCEVVDAFYLVTPPKLVSADELPEGWGHLELCGSRMMTRRHAVRSEGRTMPRELAARLIARMLGRIEQETYRAREEQRQELRKQVEAEWQRAHGREMEQLRQKGKQYDELARKVGYRGWDQHERLLRVAGMLADYDGIANIETLLESNVQRIRGDLERVEQARAALMQEVTHA